MVVKTRKDPMERPEPNVRRQTLGIDLRACARKPVYLRKNVGGSCE